MNETRREQVLRRLERDKGAWVDGTELANAEVGGSEGLKRLRELRAEGYTIQMRMHPNPERKVRQYRLIDRPEVFPRGADQLPHPKPAYSTSAPRIVFGESVACNRCHGKGKDPFRAGQKCLRCKGVGYLPYPG